MQAINTQCENGLVPTANRRQALDLDEDLLELATFYNDPKGAVERSLSSS